MLIEFKHTSTWLKVHPVGGREGMPSEFAYVNVSTISSIIPDDDDTVRIFCIGDSADDPLHVTDSIESILESLGLSEVKSE